MSQNFYPRSAVTLSSSQSRSSQHPANPPENVLTPSLSARQWDPQPSTARFPAPRLVEFSPNQGVEGDTVQVTIAISSTDIVPMLQVAFGSSMTVTQAAMVNPVGNLVLLSAQVPSWYSTRTSEVNRVPVFVAAVSGNNILDNWYIANFNYTNAMKHTLTDDRTPESKKRARRDVISSAEANLNNMATSPSEYYVLPPSPYMYIGQPPTWASRPAGSYMEEPSLSAGHTMEYQSMTTPTLDLARHLAINPDMSPPLSLGTLAGSFPPQPDSRFSAAYTLPQYLQPSEQMRQPIASQFQSTQAHIPSQSSNLTGPAPLPHASVASGSTVFATQTEEQYAYYMADRHYDPFAHIVNRANLQVQGDLESMKTGWTDEEKQQQRRLVRFWRHQEGNEVICCFAPITTHDLSANQSMIVVSCIYWESQHEYYITSVDCIHLLESLIGVRFTGEEKNRIRRNLEGFKPLTVSKLRQNSAEFFKLVMGFPDPKPRRIEKDIKVFTWSSLAEALKKIISKYTASYSSTASVNLEALGSPPPSPPGVSGPNL